MIDLVGTTTQRPAYVPADFPGRCRVFPARDTLFLDYQTRFIEDASRLVLVEKSRQIGWTWSAAYKVVRKKSLKLERGFAYDAWITSRDAEQAALFVGDMKQWAAMLDIAARDLGERVVDDTGNTTRQLAFANGLKAHSMSSNFNAQAGKRGDRVADEFALHERQRELYAIMSPGITWGGQMLVFSTHRGSHSFFNQLVQQARHQGNPKGFSLHSVTLQDALDQGFLYKLQSKLPLDDPRLDLDEAGYFDLIRRECADEESFRQEYMCSPADDNAAFLSYDLIAGCEYQPGENWQRSLDELAASHTPLLVGVDVGRDHDLTVIWVLEEISGVRFTRQVVELRDTPFAEQEDTLYPLLALPNVRRCCIDATGIGRQFAERAQQRFGRHKVEPVTFTPTSKEELAYPLRAALEDRALRLPGTPTVRSDLRAIKKVYTASDNVRFAADRGRNGHADRFWALALALHAGLRPATSHVQALSASRPGGAVPFLPVPGRGGMTI
jgi:phage FluMu gp28-like protein